MIQNVVIPNDIRHIVQAAGLIAQAADQLQDVSCNQYKTGFSEHEQRLREMCKELTIEAAAHYVITSAEDYDFVEAVELEQAADEEAEGSES